MYNKLMKTIAITAECNPLHNGHRYLFDTARRMTGADYLIVVLSGDFVQRGEPAVYSKELRTRMVLEAGADLVLELPVFYACAGAEYFARGAAALIEKLHTADTVCFGSESGDAARILEAARFYENEPEDYRAALKEALAAGLSYPAAMSLAAKKLGFAQVIPEGPNDLLGILYTRTLLSLSGTARILPVKRIAAKSASDLRKRLLSEADIRDLPEVPVSCRDFSLPLEMELQKVLRAGKDGGDAFLDVSRDLMNRIRNCFSGYEDYDSFRLLLKTKDMTYTGISRALLHILLGIRQRDVLDCAGAGTIGYARVLGMKKEAGPLMEKLRENSTIPLITRPAREAGTIPAPFGRMLAADIAASEFYDMIKRHTAGNGSSASGNMPHSEFSKPLIVI